MKKILKIVLFSVVIFLAIIGASLFLPFTRNLTRGLICSAADLETSNKVNFYSDNHLLYSIDIEDDIPLSDLENKNILRNSNFADSSSNAWYESNVNTTLTYLDNGGMIVAGTGGNGYVGQNFLNSSNYYSNNIVFSISINGNIYSSTGYIPNGYQGNGTSNYRILSISNISNSTAVGVYLRPSGTIFCQFGVIAGYEYLVNWVKVELGTSLTPYFSEEYISKLYRNYNNLDSNKTVYWSTADNTSFYDFTQDVTSDLNLYGFEDLEFNQNAEQIEAEVTYQPSYYLLEKAIDNIEYIHYKGHFKFNVSIDTSKLSDNVQFLTLRSSKKIGNLNPATLTDDIQTQTFDNFSISNIGFDDFEYMNFAVLSDNEAVYAELKKVNLIPTYTFYLVKNTGNVNIIFSPSEIYFNVTDITTGEVKPIAYGNEVENYIFYNGTEINDMNSNTNYFLNFDYLILSSNYYLNFSQLLQKQMTTISMTYNYNDYNNSDKYLRVSIGLLSSYMYYELYQSDLYTFTGYDKFELIFNGDNENNITLLTGAIPEEAYTPLTVESGFSFSQFDIIVRKPVARVDNSLVIFNYGYNNFLNSVTQTRYELRRGINYYDVVYNGQLENSKMIVIDNEFVRNSLFDEYIFVSFIIGGDNTTTYDVKDGKIGTYLGFDFNFVYYTQPLIAGNASYDLMQYRPEYMDGTPSLSPLNIPFTAWIYNAFLWLIFDCPLISDLLGLLHLNSFLGALLNIFDLYVNSGIGQFILACLSFILFWFILKSLMPFAFNGLHSSINTAYSDYKAEKDADDEFKYHLAMKQFNSNKYKNRIKPYKPGSITRFGMRNMNYTTFRRHISGRKKAFKFTKGRFNYHNSKGLSRVHHRSLVQKYFSGKKIRVSPIVIKKDNKD